MPNLIFFSFNDNAKITPICFQMRPPLKVGRVFFEAWLKMQHKMGVSACGENLKDAFFCTPLYVLQLYISCRNLVQANYLV